ncbi:hypothetical protein [Vulcanisaeta souniana]|uniref:Uncharacterized protein n=2 Tax=Vulcanisaeta souniana JCM 11219 TaxID=1293586 RepID=A0ABM8BK92_9CREN|nr:hypothetical protein [Vulcanisaeta souniana]BDR91364.1 hypothetical protein Vsou_04570 [Vulcanisaeta souniana JCM 11219]
MPPRFLLTKRHPVLPLRLDNGNLCIMHRDKYLDFLLPCDMAGNYIVIIPYQGSYVGNKPVEPAVWNGVLNTEVYALLRDELALYELSIKGGKASYVKYRVNEEFLRGISLSGDAVNDVLGVINTVLTSYIKSSFMIYTAYLRLVVNNGIRFTGYREYVRGRIKIYSRDGLVIIKEGSGNEVRLSLISTLEGLDQFTSVIMSLIRSSRVINDVRLGRIGHSVRTILDVFIPNNLITLGGKGG